MKWSPRASSSDVIDQRGGGGGRGRGVALGGGGLGLGGILIVVLLQVLGGGSSGSGGFDIGRALDPVSPPAAGGEPIPAGEDPEKDLKDFSAYVFGDAQDRWTTIFRAQDRDYTRAKLVLYRDAVSTGGCGNASSSVGPFYCPADRRVYLDLSFYGDMADQLGASGDFAWAYVIAHELGHHVQQELGTDAEVAAARRSDPGSANALSVRQELQADCYAGVWARGVYTAGQLEPGDVDEAFRAAEAVGDDRLQRSARGAVRPDTFTHGTSAQRRRWFTTGQTTGDPARCDTVAADEL